MERTQPDLVLIVARSFATKLATPTLIIDAHGDLVFFNDAAAEVLGAPTSTSARCTRRGGRSSSSRERSTRSR